jgi:hypothetical protein
MNSYGEVVVMARGRRNGEDFGPDVEQAEAQIGGRIGHNSKARAKVIRSACKELASLEAQRDEINSSMRGIRQTKIKGDLGMKLADFNAAYRLYKLEDDARSTFFDALRETFEALGVGSQLSFLGAMETTAAGEEPLA